MAAKNATHNFLYLIDDDMYVLPGWDKELSYVMEWYPEQSWINSTMIEPSGPSWATWSLRGHDFGRTPETFKEHDLLKTYHQFKDNLPPMRSTAMPCVLPKKWWDIVGGYDEEFGLAIGSEEGLAKRFWDVGFRTFINVPNSLVYHLQSTSTSRLPSYQNHMNHREATFLSKYGMTCTDFNNNYIKRGKPWLNMNS
jgi:hypothetical protein